MTEAMDSYADCVVVHHNCAMENSYESEEIQRPMVGL